MMKTIDDVTKAMINKMKSSDGKPAGMTSVYKVKWWVRSDSFDNSPLRSGISNTTTKLHKSKAFLSKEKADSLVKELTLAFKTLNYDLEGVVEIEEEHVE